MKTVYLFDAITFEFLSVYEAQESPLEEGVFIIPESATEVEPGLIEPFQYLFWTGQNWEPRFDTRGEWWDTTGVLFEILSLTDPISADWTRTKPTPIVVPVVPFLDDWQVRKILNRLEVRNQVEAVVAQASIEVKDAWALARVFKRNDPIIAQMAYVLDWDAAFIDRLFREGKLL